MKKRIMIIATAFILTATVLMTFASFGAAGDPGTETDPIVSKSYVDAKTAYTPLQLSQGQKLIGKGGTEIIMRSGIAKAIDNGANGVSDITGGKDLMSGDEVGLNHFLIIPRNDGRGIKAITEVWLLVRGDYTVI